jgi:hypothetical protein
VRFEDRRAISLSPHGKAEFHIQYADLVNAWLARRSEPAAPKIVPMLKSSIPGLRVAAVRALGRLDSEKYLPQLEHVVCAQDEQDSTNSKVPFPYAQLAIGRIQARALRGRSKAERMLKEANLDWREVAELSRKFGGPPTRGEGYLSEDTPSVIIMDELVDLLYESKRNGESIQDMAKELTLTGAQKVKLEIAGLPPAEATSKILTYIVSIKSEKPGDLALANLAVDISKQEFTRQCNELLLKIYKNPKAFKERIGKAMVVRASAYCGDNQTKKILKQMSMMKLRYLFANEATLALASLNSGEVIVYYP